MTDSFRSILKKDRKIRNKPIFENWFSEIGRFPVLISDFLENFPKNSFEFKAPFIQPKNNHESMRITKHTGWMAWLCHTKRGDLLSNVSSMRGSVSSPDETVRGELKIRRAANYSWQTLRCFIWWWNAVSNAWYYFSNEMILEGEIKDAKMSSFSSDF